MITPLFTFIILFLATALATYAMRSILQKWQLFDEPDGGRKQHCEPVVRGGGVAFALTITTYLAVQYGTNAVSPIDIVYIAIALLLLGLTGLADDFLNLPARYRIVIQFFVAAVLVLQVQQQVHFNVISGIGIEGWPLLLLVAGGVVWSINIYNFCDGIDGYISCEVATSCLIISIIAWHLGISISIQPLLIAVFGAMLGFLVFNREQATVFMGDVGSYFLGALMVIIAILLWRQGQEYLHAWMIAQSLLIVDTSITLIRRFLAREDLFKAHASHAFQHAKRRLGSANKVLLINSMFKLFCAVPLCYITIQYKMGFMFVFIAYIPALIFVLYYQGGVDVHHKNLTKLS